jgi:hypothetical protein
MTTAAKTNSAPSPLDAALAPVREALLATARREAAQVRAEAEMAAAQTLDAARGRARELLSEAREQGAQDAAADLARRRTHARREAHALILAARRDEYDGLRSAAREAAAGLVGEPGYPVARQRLAGAARRRLGSGATVVDAPGGGVLAEVAGRRLDYSLATLVDGAVDAVAAEEET